MTAAEERALKSAVMQLHVNTGHPSNDSLARAIRATEGFQRAVEAAQNVYCEVCVAHQCPQPHLPGRIRLERDVNDSIGVDLFNLADSRREPADLRNRGRPGARNRPLWDSGDKTPGRRVRSALAHRGHVVRRALDGIF